MIKKRIHTYPLLKEIPQLMAATSTVDWGDLGGRTVDSRLNQADFFHFLKLADKPVFVQQVHGNKVIRVDQNQAGQTIKGADGLVTTVPEVGLAIKTADCAPVLVYDPVKRVLGLAHAGWRSVKLDVISGLIEVMRRIGSSSADLIVCLGPHLRVCCCEFHSPELEDFLAAFSGAENLVVTRDNHQFLDLTAAIQGQLSRAGVKREKIWVSSRCTGCDSDYFSARRQKNVRGLKEVLTVGMMKGR